jgi:hypothetical protein
MWACLEAATKRADRKQQQNLLGQQAATTIGQTIKQKKGSHAPRKYHCSRLFVHDASNHKLVRTVVESIVATAFWENLRLTKPNIWRPCGPSELTELRVCGALR